LSDDATACYWNPSGLGQIGSSQLACMYNVMSMDRMLNSVNYVQPAGKLGTLGLSWLNFSILDIDGRDITGSPTGTFSDSENAFSFSLGRKLSPSLYIGGNTKFFYHKLASQKATGYGWDIGAILTIRNIIKVGCMIQDIASSIKWDTESKLKEEFPKVTRFGVSVIPKEIPITISVDYEKNIKQDAKYHVGTEYWIIPSIATRVGYDKKNITAGASVIIPISSINLRLDYAFAPDVLQQWATHRMSLVVKF